MRAAFRGAEVAAFAGGLHQKTAERQRAADFACEGVGAEVAHKAVGVVLARQKQKLHAARVAGIGEGTVQRLAGRAAAGRVAVEAEDHGVGEAEQLVHVIGCAGRAEGGDRIGEAPLRERHHVHIAFGHEHVAGVANRVAGLEQAVELTALVEDLGFGGIQVFGLVVAQHASAKANAFALDVADREHHAVAEAVVALVVLLIHDHQAAFLQQRVVVIGEHAG